MGALQPLATRWEGRLGGSALLHPLSIRPDGVCSARVTSSVRATELRGQREVGVLWGSCIGSGDRHNGSVGLIKLAACKTLGKASSPINSAHSAAFGRTAASEPLKAHFNHRCCRAYQQEPAKNAAAARTSICSPHDRRRRRTLTGRARRFCRRPAGLEAQPK